MTHTHRHGRTHTSLDSCGFSSQLYLRLNGWRSEGLHGKHKDQLNRKKAHHHSCYKNAAVKLVRIWYSWEDPWCGFILQISKDTRSNPRAVSGKYFNLILRVFTFLRNQDLLCKKETCMRQKVAGVPRVLPSARFSAKLSKSKRGLWVEGVILRYLFEKVPVWYTVSGKWCHGLILMFHESISV